MEKSHVNSLSPEDFHELSQNILLEAKEPESPVIISEGNVFRIYLRDNTKRKFRVTMRK